MKNPHRYHYRMSSHQRKQHKFIKKHKTKFMKMRGDLDKKKKKRYMQQLRAEAEYRRTGIHPYTILNEDPLTSRFGKHTRAIDEYMGGFTDELPEDAATFVNTIIAQDKKETAEAIALIKKKNSSKVREAFASAKKLEREHREKIREAEEAEAQRREALAARRPELDDILVHLDMGANREMGLIFRDPERYVRYKSSGMFDQKNTQEMPHDSSDDYFPSVDEIAAISPTNPDPEVIKRALNGRDPGAQFSGESPIIKLLNNPQLQQLYSNPLRLKNSKNGSPFDNRYTSLTMSPETLEYYLKEQFEPEAFIEPTILDEIHEYDPSSSPFGDSSKKLYQTGEEVDQEDSAPLPYKYQQDALIERRKRERQLAEERKLQIAKDIMDKFNIDLSKPVNVGYIKRSAVEEEVFHPELLKTKEELEAERQYNIDNNFSEPLANFYRNAEPEYMINLTPSQSHLVLDLWFRALGKRGAFDLSPKYSAMRDIKQSHKRYPLHRVPSTKIAFQVASSIIKQPITKQVLFKAYTNQLEELLQIFPRELIQREIQSRMFKNDFYTQLLSFTPVNELSKISPQFQLLRAMASELYNPIEQSSILIPFYPQPNSPIFYSPIRQWADEYYSRNLLFQRPAKEITLEAELATARTENTGTKANIRHIMFYSQYKDNKGVLKLMKMLNNHSFIRTIKSKHVNTFDAIVKYKKNVQNFEHKLTQFFLQNYLHYKYLITHFKQCGDFFKIFQQLGDLHSQQLNQ